MNSRNLESTDVQVRDVGQLNGELFYETNAPLTDVQIASNGSLACLKKGDVQTDLLFFRTSDVEPEVWISSEKLRMAELFAFDGERAYASTEETLFVVDQSGVRELCGSRRPILFPSRSPDGRRIVWVEGHSHRKGRVMDLGEPDQARRVALPECWLASWVGTGELIGLDLRTVRGEEEQFVLSVHSPDGSLIRELLTTHVGIIKIAGDSYGPRFVVAASGSAKGPSGIWLLEPTDDVHIRYIAPRLPESAMVLQRGCCFFGELLPASQPHTFICATRDLTCRATVPDPISDFAVDSSNRWLIYRTYGSTGSLKRIPLARIVPSELE